MPNKKIKPVLNGGEILVFMGALFWSLNAPIVKFLTLNPLLICGLRSVIAAFALSAFIRPKRIKRSFWTYIYVCSYAGLCISIVMALKLTSSPVAIGMQYTAAIWLFILETVQTKRLEIRKLIPVCVIFSGVILFMCSGTDNEGRLGNLIAFSEGIFFAIMTVSSKKSAGTNPIGLTAIANLFTGFFVFLLFPTAIMEISYMTSRDWMIMLILGIVQVACGYGFYNLGVQRVTPQKASVIALWEMILGPVWVALFLKEYPSPLVLAGFVIIIAGMLLDARLPLKSQKGGRRK